MKGHILINIFLKRVLTIILACLLGSSAFAAQDDPHLDELFEKLLETDDARRAKVIEDAIWETWLDADSPSINLMMDRSLVALNGEDMPTALSLLNAIVDLRPDFAEGWNKRASLFFLMEDYDQSLVDIQKVLELEPRHFGALSGLSSILSAYGEHKKALEVFEQALAVNPHLPDREKRLRILTDKAEGQKI